jgi:hypothetical protein
MGTGAAGFAGAAAGFGAARSVVVGADVDGAVAVADVPLLMVPSKNSRHAHGPLIHEIRLTAWNPHPCFLFGSFASQRAQTTPGLEDCLNSVTCSFMFRG